MYTYYIRTTVDAVPNIILIKTKFIILNHR